MTTILLVTRLLPYLFIAPLAGVFVDRWSRKHIMIAADLLRAAIALIYLAAGWLGSAWVVISCSVLMTSLTMCFEAAKNAAMPNMVAPRELLTANVLMFSTRFLQFTLGAALGGVTAAQFGYEAAFIINSLSFVASAIYVLAIPAAAMRRPARAAKLEPVADTASAETAGGAAIAGSEQPVEGASGRFVSDIREGFAYIWATPFVRGVILINMGWATGGGMVNILFDQVGGHLFAHVQGDRGDWNVAALFTASGAGLFIGMLLARRAGDWVAGQRRASHFIGWSLLAHGVLLAMGGLMPTLAMMALCIAASRLVLGAEFGVQETLMMRVLPDEYRGRVFTTDRSLELTTMAISTMIAGWLVTWFGPRALMVVSGLLSAIPGLVWLLAMWLRSFTVPAQAVSESYGD
jgi:MFS family permease